jgi:hypothetical protein
MTPDQPWFFYIIGVIIAFVTFYLNMGIASQFQGGCEEPGGNKV